MSRKISLFSVFCLIIGLTGVSPALAQNGPGQTTFKIEGTNIMVNGAGGAVGVDGGGCPLGYDVKQMESAANGARSAGDPDGCPLFKDSFGTKTYLQSCEPVYQSMAKMSASVLAPEMNLNLYCCAMPPGADREQCKNRQKAIQQQVNADASLLYKALGVIPDKGGIVSAEDTKKINEEKAKKQNAARQCADQTWQRITEYWGKKRGVSCVRTVTKMIQELSKKTTKEIKAEMQEKISNAMASTGVYGAMTAVVSAPSIWGAINAALSVAQFAAEIINLANQVSDLVNTLSEDCGNIVPQLKELQTWMNGITGGGNMCQALSSIIERQATQCIRINIGLNVASAMKLPQMSVMTQCPVTIDLNAYAQVGTGSFKCYTGAGFNANVATGRGKSLLSENGGIGKLFSGDCFEAPATQTATNPTGTRIPGVDCGDLDSDPRKQANVQGVNPLAPGRGVSNGWAVGGSEALANGLTVTRCDYYVSGRKGRTAYVYGQGSSCNAGPSGFMDGSYETNTSCYAGGYTPAAAPNIPDACMYEPGCLDAGGKLDPMKLGVNNCSTSDSQGPKNPRFNPNLTFIGDDGTQKPCSNFDPTVMEPVMCCDPQKQDCRNRDANTPICQCDEGDASNGVVNTQTGQCKDGGKKTCCTARLNGGNEGCAAQDIKAAGLDICFDETNQCVSDQSMGSYTGPDGRKQVLASTSLASSKPSPYLYLFIRPDAEMSGQQCCTTEWCNVCPQHYANAYGVSLSRSSAVVPPNANDSWNDSLVGKGWPFREVEGDTEIGGTQYLFGDDVTVAWEVEGKKVPGILFGGFGKVKVTGDKNYELRGSQIPLYISDSLKMPMSMSICDKATRLPTGKKSSEDLKQKGMGYAGPGGPVGLIPEPMEYPLDYLNRTRLSITDSSGVPLTAIPLCNDVKICLPDSAGSVVQDKGKVNPFIRKPTSLEEKGSGAITATTGTPTNITQPPPGSTTTPITGTVTNVPSAGNTGVTGTVTNTTGTATTNVPMTGGVMPPGPANNGATTPFSGTNPGVSMVPSATANSAGVTPVPSAGSSGSSGNSSNSTSSSSVPSGLY